MSGISSFINRFRGPRLWTNSELRRIGHLFLGDIVNVSGWQDDDKEGGKYANYFPNKSHYYLTNFPHGQRGFQKELKNQYILDLEKKLPRNLLHNFDVVFNHTTLEHVFNFFNAFSNLCLMSRDIIIIVVPFLQENHIPRDESFLDYWRFSPFAIDRLFKENGFKTIYLSANDFWNQSVYLFAIGSKNPKKWEKQFPSIDLLKFKNLGLTSTAVLP